MKLAQLALHMLGDSTEYMGVSQLQRTQMDRFDDRDTAKNLNSLH
jgi:hypothetical protein